MLSMPISSSFSETGCSTFSLANFFPFSTSSLLSFSKCSRNLNSEGKGQAPGHAVNVKWKVLGVPIMFVIDQVNLILTIMWGTPHGRIPDSYPPLWPCSRCRQMLLSSDLEARLLALQFTGDQISVRQVLRLHPRAWSKFGCHGNDIGFLTCAGDDVLYRHVTKWKCVKRDDGHSGSGLLDRCSSCWT